VQLGLGGIVTDVVGRLELVDHAEIPFPRFHAKPANDLLIRVRGHEQPPPDPSRPNEPIILRRGEECNLA
jgi:hypothetical protein